MDDARGSGQGYFRLSEGRVSAEDRWDGGKCIPFLLSTTVPDRSVQC